MMGFEDSSLKICFSCAAVYEGGGSPFLVCPNCGRRISSEEYESILRDARQAVHFGWVYRLQYEHDLEKNGKITVHYYLEPCEEILSFIALAAASGIIGGFAYDIIKKVIGSIVKFVRQKGSQEQKSKVSALVDEEENMQRFLQYVDEYYTCFENISPEVRNAIFEEMVVDKISPTLEQILIAENPGLELNKIEEINPFPQEEMFKTMIEVRRDIDRRKHQSSVAFQDFWDKVDG